MMLLLLAIFAFVCAAIPALMFMGNRNLFMVPASIARDESRHALPPKCVSVLIPARNEATGIEAAMRSHLASEGVELEVIVLDDNSDDATADIVTQFAKSDSRVRLLSGKPLPSGWNGKQHACHQLSEAARYDRFVFVDADVRLRNDALVRLIEHQDKTGVALLSAFPHQETGTWLEKWMIPLMHFILLGFLPVSRMRQSVSPAYAAGCGQLFITRREHYEQAGTHAAIRSSRHDGLKLPRAYRMANLSTDCVDGAPLAECRMYTSAMQVIRGLLKNAIEGIANPRLIFPFTVILLGGTLLPLATGAVALSKGQTAALLVSLAAILVSHLPRLLGAIQFRQSWLGVVCHVPSVLLFVMIQWQALVNHLVGHQTRWRGRLG